MLAQIWANYIYDNRCDNILLFALNIRGGSRISERAFSCIKMSGFALLILSHLLNFPWNEIICSQWGHIGFLKAGRGGSSESPEPPLDPTLGMFIFWYCTVNLNIFLLHYLYEIKFKNLFHMSFLVYTLLLYNAPRSSVRQFVKTISSIWFSAPIRHWNVAEIVSVLSDLGI